MEGIKMTKRPRLKAPYFLVAWPGMGEVAFKAVAYLVEKLGAQEFAELPPEGFFYLTGSIIEKGLLKLPPLPSGKFYFWKNKGGPNDLIVFISNAQPDLGHAGDYCDSITRLAKAFRTKAVVGFAAMPLPIDHTQTSRVWFCATSPELNNELKKFNFQAMTEGQISGMNGLFLGLAKQGGLEGFCLLGEIPLYTIQIENPKASLAVLEALGKIMNISIDTRGLAEQARHTEEEINRLLDYHKVGAGGGQAGPIGEEEIEKIKKSLSQLTKLPSSIKDKIEKLFTEVKSDISRARELKFELDKWSAYKEYEDRFLDLFKKSKSKDN